MRYMLLITMFLIGCNGFNKPYTKYKVNGRIVSCRMAANNNCGMHLWDCQDGIMYSCVTNVEVLKDE